MDLIFLVVIIGILAGSTWYIIAPMFENQPEISHQYSKDELFRQKTVLMRQIKELEMDHDIGNISDDDFAESRSQLKQDISQILSELKK